MSILFWAAAAAAAICPQQAITLEELADAIEARYADRRDSAAIAAQVREWRIDGRYLADCSNSNAFLERLNRDLDAYDGHFHVERTGAKDGEDWLLAWRGEAKTANAGLREVAVLEGNVGYLRISSFYPWDIARAKYAAAWSLLSDVDGLIVDLRQNGGGDAVTAGQLVRAALGGQVESVQSIDRRGTMTKDLLPAGELPALPASLPLVILVDRRSASASEFVAYSLQQANRAKVIGSRSAGAASLMGEPVKLGEGYQVIVPEARPSNVVSGRSWEGTGVIPDARGGDDPLFAARQLIAEVSKSAPDR